MSVSRVLRAFLKSSQPLTRCNSNQCKKLAHKILKDNRDIFSMNMDMTDRLTTIQMKRDFSSLNLA